MGGAADATPRPESQLLPATHLLSHSLGNDPDRASAEQRAADRRLEIALQRAFEAVIGSLDNRYSGTESCIECDSSNLCCVAFECHCNACKSTRFSGGLRHLLKAGTDANKQKVIARFEL